MRKKTYASAEYIARQARFAALGPAKIIHPLRYVERTLRNTLTEGVGVPSSTIQREEFERAVRYGLKQLSHLRVAIGATWNSIALTRHRQAFA